MTRALGWIQDGSDISKLKNIVEIFIPNSYWNKELRENIVPKLKPVINKKAMFEELSEEKIEIDFPLLVGRGPLKGENRSNASCSGIAQAVLPAQNGRPYQSDWATKSFIIWAIAIGFLNYDSDTDKCTLSDLGAQYAKATGKEEKNLLIKAHLSYPPVCRILNILNENPTEYFTKFEIGGKFGFTGENGFTSYGIHFIIDGLRQCENKKERTKFLSNTEGTSDKYVRTICSWLKHLGLIETGKKKLTEEFNGEKFSYELNAYRLTLEGRKALNLANGKSRHERLPKIVYYEMLATKASDANYLRHRRALLIDYLSRGFKSVNSCVRYLKQQGLEDDAYAVRDDINGFENLGLTVIKKKDEEFRISDTITHLKLPVTDEAVNTKSNIEVIKDSIRPYLKTVNHKYLALIELGFDKGVSANRDYEFMTADLLTTELAFKGARLGDTRKPDVCVYYKTNGIIIDNKAYEKGYPLPISQADEMSRYIEENKERSLSRNPNQWWAVFDSKVNHFNFAFISGRFVGTYKDRLDNIYQRTGVKGAAINSVNLIYLAELIKSEQITYGEAIKKLDCNDQIVVFHFNKLLNVEDDQDVKNLIYNIYAFNKKADPVLAQTEVQKQFGERYSGMTNQDWYNVINNYLSLPPTFGPDNGGGNAPSSPTDTYQMAAEDLDNSK